MVLTVVNRIVPYLHEIKYKGLYVPSIQWYQNNAKLLQNLSARKENIKAKINFFFQNSIFLNPTSNARLLKKLVFETEEKA